MIIVNLISFIIWIYIGYLLFKYKKNTKRLLVNERKAKRFIIMFLMFICIGDFMIYLFVAIPKLLSLSLTKLYWPYIINRLVPLYLIGELIRYNRTEKGTYFKNLPSRFINFFTIGPLRFDRFEDLGLNFKHQKENKYRFKRMSDYKKPQDNSRL